MSPRRLINGVVVAVLLLTCVLVMPGATAVERAGKSYEVALPQYIQGYWPGDDPTLCILDLTYGEYPVTDAVTQYDDVDGIDMHVTSRMVACLPGEAIVRVVATDVDLPCGEVHGCWVRGPDAFLDADGLWMHAPSGGYIALDSTIRDRGTDDHWTTLVAHEIGHALGLGHTARQDSLMHDSISSGDAVTATDIAVLNDRYSR